MTDVSVFAATPTPVGLQNASSGFADATGLVPLTAAVVLLGLLVVGLVSSARFYQWVLNSTTHFARSLEYAVKGIATALVIGVFASPFYLYTTLDGGTRRLIWQALVWSRIAEQHETVTGHRPLEGLAAEADDD